MNFFSLKEVAEILKVPTSWIYDRTRIGSTDPIPHVKMGKYIRFEEKDLKLFIENKRKKN